MNGSFNGLALGKSGAAGSRPVQHSDGIDQSDGVGGGSQEESL